MWTYEFGYTGVRLGVPLGGKEWNAQWQHTPFEEERNPLWILTSKRSYRSWCSNIFESVMFCSCKLASKLYSTGQCAMDIRHEQIKWISGMYG